MTAKRAVRPCSQLELGEKLSWRRSQLSFIDQLNYLRSGIRIWLTERT